jgi:hypothetical protein
MKVKDLKRANLTRPVKARVTYIQNLLPQEWKITHLSQNMDRLLKQEIKLGEVWTKLAKATTKKIYRQLIGEIKPNATYLIKWGEHFNQFLGWKAIWQDIGNIRNDKVKSDIWSQIRLNFWSPCLELRQRHLPQADGRCLLCGEVQQDQFHMIIHCRVTNDLWDTLFPLLYDLFPVGISEREFCFGLGGKRTVVRLRDYVTFSLRSTIHSHRNLNLGGQIRSKEIILKRFKENVRRDLRIKHETAIVANKIDQFMDTYLLKNALGKIVDGRILFSAYLME